MKGIRQAADRRGRGGPLSDEDLMVAYREGDADAMDEIIARHGRKLFGFLVRQTGSRHKAEDAYQEVFLKVVRSAGSYRPDAVFASWLYTIARNVVIDMARRDKYRRADSLDDPIGEDGKTTAVEMTPSDGPDPEENLRASEMATVLEKSIASLAAEQREVFLMRERAGLSFKEIAKITGAPLNTVKTRMHYALKHLRSSLVEAGMMDGGGK